MPGTAEPPAPAAPHVPATEDEIHAAEQQLPDFTGKPLEEPAPAAPTLTPQQMEGMFGGYAKMGDALPVEQKQRMEQLLEGSPDPDGDRAQWANAAYLSQQLGLPIDQIAGNQDAYREDYARQMFHVEQPIDDKEFYGRVGQMYQQRRDERGLLGEAQAKLFDSFRQGEANWRLPFTAALAEMKGKPGYDPARLDLYTHVAQQQWNAWQAAGQHYPQVVEAVGQYLATARKADSRGFGTDQRQRAISALQSVPDEDLDAVMGLAARQQGAAKAPEEGGIVKGAERFGRGVADTAVEGGRGLADLALGTTPGGAASALGDQFLRKAGRKLDQAVAGQFDPDKGSNWLSEGVLSAAEGLPRMLAMFHPAGVVLNLGAFSEEARGHFEDAGVAPDRAGLLGLAASIPLTALMAVNSKVVLGKAATQGMERWMAGNIAGKVGSDLVRGYAKNMAAHLGENTMLLAGATAGQQLTEPAIQSVGKMMDATIPGIKWTGKDGELSKLARATPQTLAQLVPLIALGTGMGMLRSSADAAGLVHNEAALRAMGFPDEAVRAVLDTKDPATAVLELQKAWLGREANPDAVTAMNVQTAAANPGGTASLNTDGTLSAKDAGGNVVGQSATAEGAAQTLDDLKPGETRTPPAAQPLGFLPPGFATANRLMGEAVVGSKNLFNSITTAPKLEGFKKVLNRWVGDRQLATMQTLHDVKNVVRALPDALTREAVSNWIEAGGDRAQLEAWAKASTRLDAKKGYEAALKLTPEQLQVAERLRQWFNDRFTRAEQAGVVEKDSFRENYVTHLVEQPFVGGGPGSNFSGKLGQNFKFSKERSFPNFFEMENAVDDQGHNLGFRAKTKDIAEIMAAYDLELNKSILTRQLMKDLLETKNIAGEPLAVPIKGAISTEGEGAQGNFITNPGIKEVDEKLYKPLDHASLRKWWWIGKDSGGKETFMQGELGLHPDIKEHMENVLGGSGIRKWYNSDGSPLANLGKATVKALDKSNQFVKQNMLGGLSTFHAVHEVKRAGGNIVNPFKLPAIDPNAENTKQAVRSGLMLTGDRDVANFAEGLGAHGSMSMVDRLPVIGKVSEAVSHLTFHELIPRLKMKTWDTLQARNLKTFAKEIAAGTVTEGDVAYLTSHQVNARFGHLNYADMGRNATFQHFLSATTLAPDFWEANIRNYGQAFAGLATGSKVGRQPAIAFAVTAASIWLVSRALNMALNDDRNPHFEDPFAVVADGRRYTMRNEAGDLFNLLRKPSEYISGRLSPMLASLDEWRTGRNWRGEKVNTKDVMEEFAAKIIPMSARWAPGIRQLLEHTTTGSGRTVSPFQEFLSAQGVSVSRHSPLNDAYELAGKWKKAQGDKEDTGTYPVSQYQQLRYALEDGDDEKAKEQVQKLRGTHKGNLAHVNQGFRNSLFNPWTGSEKRDREFKASLDDVDRMKIQIAEDHRRAVWTTYQKLDKSLPNP